MYIIFFNLCDRNTRTLSDRKVHLAKVGVGGWVAMAWETYAYACLQELELEMYEINSREQVTNLPAGKRCTARPEPIAHWLLSQSREGAERVRLQVRVG